MPSTTTFSRITLVVSAALLACMCLVNAAPSSKSLELEAASPIHIKMLKKNVDEDEDTATTTIKTKTKTKTKTSAATATAASSGKFSGDGTFYNLNAGDVGSCGYPLKESDMIVALNYKQMANGANPNNNPKCGRSITAKGPNGKVTVTVADTCPGCAYGDLDLTPAAFNLIGNPSEGRIPITWSWDS